MTISPAAERDLKRLARRDRQTYERVRAAIRALAEDPRPPGARKLAGRESYRVRVGDHRIIYLVDDAALVVTILGVRHRREVYR